MNEKVERFKITCIICPIGCNIEILKRRDKILKIKGNRCKRGIAYALQEIKEPKRIVMSVIMVKNGDLPTISVKTDKPVLKRFIPIIMRELANIEVEAPIKMGQVIVRNIANLGVNIIATRPVRRSI